MLVMLEGVDAGAWTRLAGGASAALTLTHSTRFPTARGTRYIWWRVCCVNDIGWKDTDSRATRSECSEVGELETLSDPACGATSGFFAKFLGK